MSLSIDVSAALPGLRLQAEALMLSTCTVSAASGLPVLNEVTGEYTTVSVIVYSGRCRVRFSPTIAAEQNYAGQLRVEQAAVVSLPVVGSEAVGKDARVTITGSPNDAGLVGKVFRVTGFHGQTFATARRLAVQLVS